MMARGARHSTMTALEQLQEKFHDLKERLHDLGGIAKEVARERWDGLRHGASHSLATGRERAHELEETLEEKVREHPMRWVLISAGVGLLLGSLLRRR
jgi:ElaB/YqjD/DUF883 family membrane-anchored ribosome-binding protein